MIDIQWKGKIGYGDIVSPICYAHNLSYKLQTPVNLTFRWNIGKKDKIQPRDAETLWERANYVSGVCDKKDVSVNIFHAFNDPIPYNHSNYDWNIVGRDKFHNYWRPQHFNSVRRRTIVVNSTLNNSQTLAEYGKPWKDPAAQKWSRIIERLKLRDEVVEVDYTTPIEKLFHLLTIAKGFVGYHGTAAWIAKLTHTPSLIFSDGGSTTTNAFPYSFVVSKVEDFGPSIDYIDSIFSTCLQRTEQFEEQYRTYMPSAEFLNSLKHD